MIKVNVTKNQSGLITSFEMSGHANFAVHGSDLVCAAASAVSFGSVNAIASLTKTIPVVKQGQEGGYLFVTLPASLDQEEQEKIQLLLNAMIVSLQTIEHDYGKYIKITFQT
ncbi:ribosomal-processing cysteine protease Prp [Paenisporosarcina cavernae]|uniref:Ribosomal processing cysteine protease Prp n=1 Tax=Paenisporosarcina cavernae TaxID=2320858 RepID=A0A385YSF8_9BACL|nr:ribosomal-processing cysteine protease Prp [Paenisporosarcina cavernae]AYC29739.1 ribosomal-processing cysteine protease Prp [Paenisporosarcina cavernae]